MDDPDFWQPYYDQYMREQIGCSYQNCRENKPAKTWRGKEMPPSWIEWAGQCRRSGGRVQETNGYERFKCRWDWE